jgi:ribonuclease HI
MQSPTLEIYTDGACEGNQFEKNYGGWGVIITQNRQVLEKLSGAAKETTNNRMEMYAIIEALRYLERFESTHSPGKYILYSDSAYIVNCFKQKWYEKWMKNGWKTSKGTPVKNQDLWQTMLSLMKPFSHLKIVKIEGHAGHKFNEMADQTAVTAIHERFD